MHDNNDIIVKKIEMRGISREEIADYFVDISESAYGDKIFYGIDWVVEVGDEKPCLLGSITLKEVDIIFSASQETLEVLLADFRLKFMRAGG